MATTPVAATRATAGQAHEVLAVVAAVVVQDQATKWWAWRHVWAVINPGATAFLGARTSAVFAAPTQGALLNLAGLALLSAALVALLRRPRRRLTLVAWAALVAGWISNLLDRLAMHAVTAPGSERGAVDFIHLGNYYYNVADVYIVGGAAALLLTAMQQWLRRVVAETRRPRLASPATVAGMCLVCATSFLVVAGSLQPAAHPVVTMSQSLSAWTGGPFARRRPAWTAAMTQTAEAPATRPLSR